MIPFRDGTMRLQKSKHPDVLRLTYVDKKIDEFEVVRSRQLSRAINAELLFLSMRIVRMIHTKTLKGRR